MAQRFGRTKHQPETVPLKIKAWKRGLWQPEPETPKPDRAKQRQAAIDRLMTPPGQHTYTNTDTSR